MPLSKAGSAQSSFPSKPTETSSLYYSATINSHEILHKNPKPTLSRSPAKSPHYSHQHVYPTAKRMPASHESKPTAHPRPSLPPKSLLPLFENSPSSSSYQIQIPSSSSRRVQVGMDVGRKDGERNIYILTNTSVDMELIETIIRSAYKLHQEDLIYSSGSSVHPSLLVVLKAYESIFRQLMLSTTDDTFYYRLVSGLLQKAIY